MDPLGRSERRPPRRRAGDQVAADEAEQERDADEEVLDHPASSLRPAVGDDPHVHSGRGGASSASAAAVRAGGPGRGAARTRRP